MKLLSTKEFVTMTANHIARYINLRLRVMSFSAVIAAQPIRSRDISIWRWDCVTHVRASHSHAPHQSEAKALLTSDDKPFRIEGARHSYRYLETICAPLLLKVGNAGNHLVRAQRQAGWLEGPLKNYLISKYLGKLAYFRNYLGQFFCWDTTAQSWIPL